MVRGMDQVTRGGVGSQPGPGFGRRLGRVMDQPAHANTGRGGLGQPCNVAWSASADQGLGTLRRGAGSRLGQRDQRPGRRRSRPARPTGSGGTVRPGRRPPPGSSPRARTTTPARRARSALGLESDRDRDQPDRVEQPADADERPRAAVRRQLGQQDGPERPMAADARRPRRPRRLRAALTTRDRAITGSQAASRIALGQADRHHREEDERDDREDDARAGEPALAPAAVERHGRSGSRRPSRDGRAERLERAQRLAPDEDREHDLRPPYAATTR